MARGPQPALTELESGRGEGGRERIEEENKSEREQKEGERESRECRDVGSSVLHTAEYGISHTRTLTQLEAGKVALIWKACVKV